MPSSNPGRQAIDAALRAFFTLPLVKASLSLLDVLGYTSEKTADLGSTATALLANI
jgi:hypothetical protein